MSYVIESEKAIVSLLINEPETSWLFVNSKLTKDDFAHEFNKRVFIGICEFYNQKKPVDLPLLAEKTGYKTSDLEKYVTFPSKSKNLKDYVETLIQARLERHLKSLQFIFDNKAKTLDDKLNATDDFLKQANQELSEFNDIDANHISNIVDGYLETVEYEKDIPIEERVVFTGFYDLDKIIRLYFGETSTIFGRPGMAKSAWATQFLMDNVVDRWQGAYYILETSGEHLLERYVSKRTGILLKDIKDRVFYKDKEQRIKFFSTLQELKSKNVHLFDARYRNYEKFKLSLQQLVDKGLRFFVADFGQLFYMTKRSFPSRALELSHIAYDLSETCVVNKLHGNIVLQLNRKVEERQDKRPLLSDLKESGAWEESVSTALGLYRDEYYNNNTEKPGIAEILILKNRNGSLGNVELLWVGEKFEFRNPLKQEVGLF